MENTLFFDIITRPKGSAYVFQAVLIFPVYIISRKAYQAPASAGNRK
jgi:hypothetical protein